MMISRGLFFSLRQFQNKTINPLITKCKARSFSSNSDDEKTDNKKETKDDKKRQSNEALKKLNVLLQQMINEDNPPIKSDLKLAKPKQKLGKKERGIASGKEKPIEKQLEDAAKNVAETLGGDTKKTELELLAKLLNSSSDKDLDKPKASNLSDVIVGMKIERDRTSVETSRAAQVKKVIQQDSFDNFFNRIGYGKISKRPKFAPFTHTEIIEKIDLFGAEPLHIFPKDPEKLKTKEVNLETWNALEKRELKLAVTHPPENYFQEMILWTEQGKLWKFPVDNEEGMEEEHSISFAEHIFLDKHLEGWCPQKGPIRHFMELVCVGLSKNPYLSAQAKKDHILWYKEYFETKKDLLVEVGAIPLEANIEKVSQISDQKEENNS